MMPRQWPLKIILVHPKAQFLRTKKLIIAADCSLLVHPDNYSLYIRGTPVLIGCPLLEDPDATMNKLRLILKETTAKELLIYTMEVPCCQALHMMVKEALRSTERNDIVTKHYIVRVFTGKVEDWIPGRVDQTMTLLEKSAHKGMNLTHHKVDPKREEKGRE